MVIIVAAVLSLAATGLKPFQDKNEEIAKKLDILRSVEKGLDAADADSKNDYVEAEYDKYITESFVVKSNGDLLYEGDIVEYRISPTTATANNTAAQNRLTISVNVRFFDKSDPEAEFEKRFSFYYDYPGSSQLIGSQKDTAIDEIFERITQDVFNASLAKW